MKRPFATIGFSMLATFLLVTNISHRLTVALGVCATVIFLLFIAVKGLRKYQYVIFSLIGVIALVLSFVSAEKYYYNEEIAFSNVGQINGVVCQTPTSSDYAFSYIIKLDNKDYKIRFVAQEDKFLNEGDCVAVNIGDYDKNSSAKLLKHSLSSNIFFTVFESDNSTVKPIGKTNFFYKNVGIAKREFSKIVDRYLPSESGAIAKAMTIGDDAEIEDKTVSWFKNSGTSHLLVISGLHLTLWSFGIIRYLNKSKRLRKYSVFIGLACLFAYASIAGFSVSVIRAGAMACAVLLARLFRRDADSINSIGFALVGILLFNPFAPFSVALWLTVFSTVGILIFSDSISLWIERKFGNTAIRNIPFYSTIKISFSISISVAIATLPIMIVEYKMMPMLSIFANLFMVNAALILMVLTVVGVVAHFTFLYPIAKVCYLVVGVIGKYLLHIAEVIGTFRWSTISLDNRVFKGYLLFFLFCVCLAVIIRKNEKNIVSFVAVILSVSFVLLCVYCVEYDYNTPSVEISFADDEPVVIVNSQNDCVLVGVHGTKSHYYIDSMLNKHNKKKINSVVVSHMENDTVSRIISLNKIFGVDDFYLCEESSQMVVNFVESGVSGVKVGKELYVNVENITEKIEFTDGNKCILLINCEKSENLFQNDKMYDIIIAYGDNCCEYVDDFEKNLKNSQSKVIIAKENEAISVYF